MKDMMIQLIDTFSSLHDIEKIAHRDVKPSNILISKYRYQISDFGVCKF